MNLDSASGRVMSPLPSTAIRKISLRSRASVRSVITVKVPCDHYRPRIVYCESKLERMFVMLWLARDVVYDLREQFVRFAYKDSAGKERIHVFDFIVTLRSGRRFAVIVKHGRAAAKPQFKDEVKQIAAQLPKRIADDVVVFTDRSFQRFEAVNAERFVNMRDAITECDRRAVLRALQGSIGYMRVDALLARADYPPSGFAVLLELLLEEKLVQKHQQVLEADSLIRMAEVL